MTFTELKLVQKVTNVGPDSKVVVTMTPVVDKDVVIEGFIASVGHDLSTNACITWDDGGTAEKIIWTINGNDEINFKFVIDSNDVDGVKKLSLILLNNSGTDNVYMSAMCKVRQK